MKKVHGLSLGGGASQGDREGASREVGGEPGEGGGDPGSQEGEMNFTCYGEARKVTPATSQHILHPLDNRTRSPPIPSRIGPLTPPTAPKFRNLAPVLLHPGGPAFTT